MNDDKDPPMTAAEQTNADEMSARQRLQALRLLDSRRQRLEHEVKSTRKKWSDKLTELTQSLNGKIKDNEPSKDNDCRKALKSIKKALEKREAAEKQKKREIDEATSKLAEVEAGIIELIRSRPSDQQTLELDPEAAGSGVYMTNDTAKAVGAAMEDHVEQGGEMTADMDDLKGRLKDLGVEGLSLVPNDNDEPE